MSPKPGTKVTLIPPISPIDVVEADDATSGSATAIEVGTIEKKKGSFEAVKAKPYKPPQTQEEREQKPAWIEIELKDDQGNPVAGERYRAILPDGTTAAEGTLDAKGLARIDGIEPGSCEICFPNRDKSAWKPA